MPHTTVEVPVEITVEGERAYKVISCLTNHSAWIPKTLIEVEGYEKTSRTATFKMPEWLAKEKDLV